MKLICKIAIFISLAPCAFANHFFSYCPVHTWHKVKSLQGEWEINLRMINEEGLFVDQACKPITRVPISTASPLTYGFGFNEDATFDIAYTVTAVQLSHGSGFESKTCVFVVTANGPAQPDIQALGYHGATCQWKIIPGVGEDFIVG
ncbi:hypothetical protein [Legionella longbeachae]|uniref:hypothetical protein n=1 Tax=Legionella longbeachae TaxID=450 RepID=UPI00124631DF|nr:hypothetical protein [Legionella longbeachae]QEY53132.1 hypothetical protein FQU71_18935 [Legionella longbeachae]